jgi:hypothetical protein
VISIEIEAIERRRQSPRDTERRMPTALPQKGDVGAAVIEQFDLVDRSESATVHSGPRAVRPQRPLGEDDRV